MKSRLLALGLLLLAAPLCGQENPSSLAEFTSEDAIKAVKLYEEKLAMLDVRLAEQIQAAQAALLADLRGALQVAVMANDFPEVQRLSKFLQDGPAELSPALGKAQGDDKPPAAKPAAPVAAAAAPTGPRLDDPEEVRKRFDQQLAAAKMQAIADFEQIAREAVAQGQLDRAAEIWEEVIALDLGHQEAGKFFSRVKRKKAPVSADDGRNVWQDEAEPNSGYMKTRTGWIRLNQGKPGGQLQEVERTAHTITLQSGNNTYRLHRDAQYGRGGPHLKWHFHGPGRWVR